ncbi:MAG: transporter [Deltaproteobacteria bacterium HGW-Deltaproteobacteria-15]|jgi:osmotically-inducible protein OsmY|nr:MAG: transporter [Deltaproteobacteria bacterium HGW-Deltaproteobacteria-15]
MKRFGRGFTAALVLIFLMGLVACSTPAGRSAGSVIDDGTITSKVKTKLLADDRLSGIAISVDTFKGEVTLSGGANTAEQKQLATEIAQSVKGVRGVNNVIILKK